MAKIKVVSAAIKHAPPKAAPHGFFSAHAPKCADASTTAQIPSASFADTSGGRIIIADDIARNLLLLLLGRRLRLKVTVFGRPVCLLKTSSSSSSNLDGNARNEERGRVRVLFDGETRDSSVAFGEMTSRKESAHFDSIFLTRVLKVLRNAAFFLHRAHISVDRKKDGDATFEEGDAHRTASMRFASLSKVGRFGTFGTGGGIITRGSSSSSFSSSANKTNDAKMMQQKPADQKRVALGVACGLVACAIPFLFKDVQKRELEVSRARDGGGGGGGRGGFGDGKEEARKERLMTTSKSGGRKRRE